MHLYMLTVPNANIKKRVHLYVYLLYFTGGKQYKDLVTDANLFWNLKIINILDGFYIWATNESIVLKKLK